MSMKSTEIERAIDIILGIEPEKKKKKRGRKHKPKPPVWSLDFYDPANNRTYALISMCIKEDFEQSLEKLALRLSTEKGVHPTECLSVLLDLREAGRLGCYDDSLIFRMWHGEEAGYGLEKLCG